MSKYQRTKGHNFERFLAGMFQIIDPTALRNLEYQEGGGRDIKTKLPLCVQAKCGKQISKILVGLKEAQGSAVIGEYSICVMRLDRDNDYVLMTFNDWFDLFQSWWELTNK